jgi:aryl-alcohol dehydrogenase-like predicted oxidoreductase
VFPHAREKRVGILARVPLASGLLSGKMTRERHFDPDDHRVTNRHGEQFDRGETFSGVDFETGLQAAEELKRLVPPGATLAQVALRWILMFDAVSCAIPGARTPDQAEQNTSAADLPPLSEADMRTAQEVYDRLIRPQVRHLW